VSASPEGDSGGDGNAPYRVALPEFEGPLDLLLHLCKTHEIAVVDLPIAFITEKYLEYLERMQSMPVDIAADYLVMAATLAYLKSRELVPSPEPLEVLPGEEEEVLDPREELIRRLLEYQKYKDAAERLGAQPVEGRNVFLRGAPLEAATEGSAPLADHSVWKLIEAFGKILEKTGNKKLTHEVTVDNQSIGDRVNQLVDRLEAAGGSMRFEALFDLDKPEPELRRQVVVTLLAVLEMARLKVIRVLQAPDAGELFITRVEGATLDSARRLQITSALEGNGEENAARNGEGNDAVDGAAADHADAADAPTAPPPAAPEEEVEEP
jgi:segregation and condensation protein A